MRRRVPALVCTAVLLAVSGCSSGQTTLATLTDPPSVEALTTTASSSGTSSIATTDTAGGVPLEGADLVTVVASAPAAADEAAVFHAYVEFWQADMAALARSDPAWPPLLERVSGQQRTGTVALLTANRDKGQHVTGTITIRPQVLVVRGAAATVRDCADLSGSQAVDSAGRPVDGTKGKAGVEYSVTLVQSGPRWTVDNIDTVESANGTACTG